jgi:hypothetical protein
MIALQPEVVKEACHKARLTWEQRLQRHTKAFHRQGEWFFVPRPDMKVDRKSILKDEPIQRGNRSKPHIIEELYREGGVEVMVCPKHPNGLLPHEHALLIQNNPAAAKWLWMKRQRDATAYARGKVKHADHATLILPCWHLIAMNTETQSRTMRNVAFLD